jgi:hypothetical protein
MEPEEPFLHPAKRSKLSDDSEREINAANPDIDISDATDLFTGLPEMENDVFDCFTQQYESPNVFPLGGDFDLNFGNASQPVSPLFISECVESTYESSGSLKEALDIPSNTLKTDAISKNEIVCFGMVTSPNNLCRWCYAEIYRSVASRPSTNRKAITKCQAGSL